MSGGSGRLEDWLGSRWRRASAGAAAVLRLAGAVSGYLLMRDDGSAPATLVLGETFTSSTTTVVVAPQLPAARRRPIRRSASS